MDGILLRDGVPGEHRKNEVWRLRSAGFLNRITKLQQLQKQLKINRPAVKANTLLRKCPCCKTGMLATIEVFGKRGPPEHYLVEKQPAPAPLA